MTKLKVGELTSSLTNPDYVDITVVPRNFICTNSDLSYL